MVIRVGANVSALATHALAQSTDGGETWTPVGGDPDWTCADKSPGCCEGEFAFGPEEGTTATAKRRAKAPVSPTHKRVLALAASLHSENIEKRTLALQGKFLNPIEKNRPPPHNFEPSRMLYKNIGRTFFLAEKFHRNLITCKGAEFHRFKRLTTSITMKMN